MHNIEKKRGLQTDSGISPILLVKLNFRAWQWAHLVRVDPAKLKGRHHWIQPAGSSEPQACEPLDSLGTLLDHCQSGRAGAGLVNLELVGEIDSRRDRCQSIFAAGAVWPHAGDREAVEELGFDTKGCRWFTTQITEGETGENWRILFRELRIEAASELVHQLHDAVNFLGTFQTAHGRLPDAPWTRVAKEIRIDFGDGAPDAFDRQLRKVYSDLQKLNHRTLTPLRLKGDLPAQDLAVLGQLVGTLESALQAIAQLVDSRRENCARDPAPNLEADLVTWRELLDKVGRIQL